jgi:uncharacterized DUF497 family protein
MEYDWDDEKDAEIQEKHGISFQEIRTLIERGQLVKILENRSAAYPGQKILLVRKGKLIYMVPFEIRDNTKWLITAFYNDYLTKKYTREKK